MAKAKSKAKSAAKAKAMAKTKSKVLAKSTSKASAKSPSTAAMKTKGAAKTKKATAPAKSVANSRAKKSAPMTAKFANLFHPLDDRILLERTGASERTAGGLYIPSSAADADRPVEGMVLAVGRGHRSKRGGLRPLDVKPGDKVIYRQFSGSEIELDGEEYLVLREEDLLGIITT